MKKAIAYYRVSTDRQEESGLGIEAQIAAVHALASREEFQIIGEYTETGSGKLDKRPVLKTALARCQKNRATLLVAKLDRLSRRLSYVAKFLDSKTDFRAADNPHANRFQLNVLALFAEHERDLISTRTKEALAVVKQRGTVLGRQGHVLAKQNINAANEFAQAIRPTIDRLRSEGFTTIRALRDELNRQQIPTPRGTGSWHHCSVHNLLNRLR